VFHRTMKTPPFMLRLLDALDVLKPYQVNLWFIGGSFLIGGICAALGYWHLGHWASYVALALVGIWIFPFNSLILIVSPAEPDWLGLGIVAAGALPGVGGAE
jgi:uncharacterized membrane protein (DUF2068 family)